MSILRSLITNFTELVVVCCGLVKGITVKFVDKAAILTHNMLEFGHKDAK